MRILFFLLTYLALIQQADADIYKCTNEEGKSIYRPHPCQEGFDNHAIDLRTGVATHPDDPTEDTANEQKIKQAQEAEQIQKQQAEQQAKALAEQAAIESNKNQDLIKNNPGQFSAYAIPPYAPDKLSNLVKHYQARLADIEHFRGLAALHALATGECGRVEASELNEKSSSQSLVFLVNCSSAKNFYFSEQDLAK